MFRLRLLIRALDAALMMFREPFGEMTADNYLPFMVDRDGIVNYTRTNDLDIYDQEELLNDYS